MADSFSRSQALQELLGGGDRVVSLDRSDLLQDLLRQRFNDRAVDAQALGLGVEKVVEDRVDQLDGADAVDIVRVAWSPTIDAPATTQKFVSGKGKAPKLSPLFGYRGSRPVELDVYPDEDEIKGYVSPVISGGPQFGPAGDVESVSILPGGSLAPRLRGVFPAEEVIAIASPGSEIVDFTLYPSYFVRDR